MSIINQTLRELDARRIDFVPPQVPLHPAPNALRRRLGRWIAGVAVLSVAGLMVAWVLSRPAETVRQAPADSAQRAMMQLAARPAASVPLEPVAVAATASAQPETVVSVHPIKPAELQVNVQENTGADPLETRPAAPGPTKPDAVIASPPVIQKKINQPAAEEEAEERYRKAVELVRKGREDQARPLLEEALGLFPGHIAARQTLVALLSEAGHNLEAEAVLREGRTVVPDSAWFALSLARLQAARGDAETAAATLLGGIASRGVNAEYHATLGGLLMHLERHPEAARQYQLALRLQPEQGSWWLGLGLSRAAQGQTDEARAAYRRALAAGNLPEKLLGFVRAKLAE